MTDIVASFGYSQKQAQSPIIVQFEVSQGAGLNGNHVLVWSAICKLELVYDCRTFILITPGIEFLVDLAMIPHLVFYLRVPVFADRIILAE
jgi:hypothetical protein